MATMLATDTPDGAYEKQRIWDLNRETLVDLAAKTSALVEEIKARLKHTPRIERVTVDGKTFHSLDDLDPKPEPQSLAERARALSRVRNVHSRDYGDEMRGLLVDLAAAVDELQAQVAALTPKAAFIDMAAGIPAPMTDSEKDRELYRLQRMVEAQADIICAKQRGPDLLEAAKQALPEVHSGLHFAYLRDAIAAEEARRRA